MIKIIIRAINSAFIAIVFISSALALWTGYAFVSQPTKSIEIVSFIQDIYESQKTVIVDFVELSKLLIKDTSESNANENNNLLQESELQTDPNGKSNLDKSSTIDDNSDNPLGIIVEPSSSDVKEKRLSEIGEQPYIDKQSEVSNNEMEMM